ncbi:IgGFc-binding protein-like [Tubulanus polymorphus]|uniref:IgGFc-binding protein-like n=1 Tax=Tubulanus polymorphus TaxID=672921 RepID=UPI003DA254C9
MCGNLDGSSTDDEKGDTCYKSGGSCIVPRNSTSCGARTQEVTKDSKYETDEYCGKLKNPNGPFKACWDADKKKTRALEMMFEDCVYDMTMFNDEAAAICPKFNEAHNMCTGKGFPPSTWRSESFCKGGLLELRQPDIKAPPNFQLCT